MKDGGLDADERLRRLGAGESIAAVCRAAGISREDFDAWWSAEAGARVPGAAGERVASVRAAVDIERDAWGIAHIHAENDEDLFFGFGYAMAQDRLFQLDYLRRQATGHLAQVVGRSALESDTVARTVGFPRTAQEEWRRTGEATRRLVEAFSGGVNAWLAAAERLPIEFDLLGYRPHAWSAPDCCAIAVAFRHYLTVRLPVIVIPELAGRALGAGALYRAFMQGEADDESILHPGEYPVGDVAASPGRGAGDADEGQGSNNWVLGGARTTTGKPIVASDPHIAFAAVSCWYEAHLRGGSFDVAGMAYVGMPAIMFGRNRRVAWGITNNICSQRDLYLEKTDPAHPGAFLFDGEWEPGEERAEAIEVRDADTVSITVRASRNGPVVTDLLPEPARNGEVVTLRWLGAQACGWLTALLDLDRARSVEELRAALHPWRVPTWNLVFADVDGRIGYHAAGAIPLRGIPERGYRPGWDPAHQWQALVEPADMPQLGEPRRDWIVTANNRPAPDDFNRPLAGTWSSGHRARRIRELIESRGRMTVDDVAEMQQDALSLRARTCVPRLVAALAPGHDTRLRDALEQLRRWDHVLSPQSIAASIFEVFFARWSDRVAAERFAPSQVALLGPAAAGLASALLADDPVGWFDRGNRADAIADVMEEALDDLASRLGPNMRRWTWGSLHRIHLRHVLSGRGDLGTLLDRGGLPVRGNGVTVCNTGFDPNWGASMGANYRMVADLGSTPPVLLAVDAQGASGHPGSAHYGDQLAEWIEGRYHRLHLGPPAGAEVARSRLRLVPSAG